MKIQERLVFLLIFLFLLPIGVIAQQKMITGQVVDEQGEAVIGASVMVKGAKPEQLRIWTEIFLFREKRGKRFL